MTNVNTAIEVRNVTRKFGDVKALDDVSLSIEQHTISALLGANGAGKTTLMSLLAGHDRPTSGALRVGEAVPLSPASWPHTPHLFAITSAIPITTFYIMRCAPPPYSMPIGMPSLLLN